MVIYYCTIDYQCVLKQGRHGRMRQKKYIEVTICFYSVYLILKGKINLSCVKSLGVKEMPHPNILKTYAQYTHGSYNRPQIELLFDLKSYSYSCFFIPILKPNCVISIISIQTRTTLTCGRIRTPSRPFLRVQLAMEVGVRRACQQTRIGVSGRCPRFRADVRD